MRLAIGGKPFCVLPNLASSRFGKYQDTPSLPITADHVVAISKSIFCFTGSSARISDVRRGL